MSEPLTRLESARIRLEHKVIARCGYDAYAELRHHFLELEDAIRAELGKPRRVVLPGEPGENPWEVSPVEWAERRESLAAALDRLLS